MPTAESAENECDTPKESPVRLTDSSGSVCVGWTTTQQHGVHTVTACSASHTQLCHKPPPPSPAPDVKAMVLGRSIIRDC